MSKLVILIIELKSQSMYYMTNSGSFRLTLLYLLCISNNGVRVNVFDYLHTWAYIILIRTNYILQCYLCLSFIYNKYILPLQGYVSCIYHKTSKLARHIHPSNSHKIANLSFFKYLWLIFNIQLLRFTIFFN